MKSHRNIEAEVLLFLLRTGLWGRKTDSCTVFPLSDEEWKRVFVAARKQTVEGITYEALALLPEEWLPQDALLFRWAAEAERIEQRNRQMNKVLAELHGLFTAHGLHPVVLKGQGTALCYHHPELRQCGDIDWFFPSDNEQLRAADLIRENGYQVDDKADGSRVYLWKGIEVEHHRRLLDSCNPFVQREISEWTTQEGYEKAKLADGSIVNVPAPLLHLLLLNTHILKHALGHGIGLRQLCDLARAYAVLGSRTDGTAYREACRRLGMLRWNRMLHAFLTTYLGLPDEVLPYHEPDSLSPAPLLRKVWKEGNFGQEASRQTKGKDAKWKRKKDTARAYLGNMGFACRYAPAEAFWTVSQLIKGQLMR